MGGHLSGLRSGVTILSEEPVAVVRVVPAVATFAIEDGFWYTVPEGMTLEVGAVVRVPLSGRRVKGFVVEVGLAPAGRLKPVAARSGRSAIFDENLLKTLRWASHHYVAPLAVVLERSAPPKVPPALKAPKPRPVPSFDSPIPDGWKVVWITPGLERLPGLVASALRADESVMVVAATASEVDHLAATLGESGLESAVVGSDDSAEQVTEAWRRAQTPPTVLVGTPRIASWRMPGLGLAVVCEDGRRAMKDRQTPTIHVRELLIRRATEERFRLVMAGPTPSVEALSWSTEVSRQGKRAWGLVEVIERDSGSGLLAEATKQAVRAVVKEGGKVFVFVHRQGYAAAVRCVRCRKLRRCASCGSSPDVAQSCPRCGEPTGPCLGCGGTRFEPLGAGVGRALDELRRIVPSVERYPTAGAVTVGTERDLADLELQDLVVMVDADGLIFGHNYRSAEEAVRIGARLANRVRTGRRMIVQTAEPSHPAVDSLRRGDPIPFLESERRLRSQFGYPPAGELAVMVVKGDFEPIATGRLISDAAKGAMVLGPAATRDGQRWLIQGKDLDEAKSALRTVVQRLRETGATVRIDVDPIDL